MASGLSPAVSLHVRCTMGFVGLTHVCVAPFALAELALMAPKRAPSRAAFEIAS
jgi:hypothetical protein